VTDALKLIQFGLPTVPAKNFSAKQLEMVRNSKIEDIFLFYDEDEAGRYAVNNKGVPIHFTAKAQFLFGDCGINVNVGSLGKRAKDPAELKSKNVLLKCNPILKDFV
jgi:hypothetical protein